MSMFMLSPGDSLMQGFVADRERDDFNASETARVIKERGYEPGVLYDNDFLIPEDEAERVENEEPGLDRSGGAAPYADDNAFKADGVMLDASRILHDFNYKIGTYTDPDRTFPSGIAKAAAANRTQSVAQRTDDEIAEYGLEAGGALNYHLETQALTAFSDQPDEVKLAIAALLDGYEQLPNGTRAGSMRMFKGMAFSPTMYLGAGSIGAVKNLLQFGGKQAAKRTLRDRLLRTVLGAQFIGAEGAGYAAFSDYAMQKNEAGDEPFKLDTTRLATAAGMGYGFGAALTGAVAVAPSAVKAGAGMVRDMTRPGMRSGVGPIPETPPVAQAADEVATDLDPQGFFSAVSRSVDAVPMEKGSGAQMRAMIAKGEGVKAEEMAWTGLDDFLAGKKSVTKQEVRDYVDANQVQVEEVVKGTAPDKGEIRKAFQLQNQTGTELTNAALKSEMLEREAYSLSVQIQRGEISATDLPVELQPLALKHFSAFQEYSAKQEGRKTTTKFGEYTLPGGENYREVLLKLPEQPVTRARYAIKGADGHNVASNATTRNEAIAEAGGDASRVVEIREKNTVNPNFTGPHYDEPNVLAHIRLNDRTGPNGEKILFVEEIQSDWHQKGRKQGYADSERPYEVFDVREDNKVVAKFATEKEAEKYVADQGVNYLDFDKSKGVPDAPLKKGWHEISFRRVARMAAEEGYDAIAWTPGKVQAERYDLSKQIDELRYQKNDDGTFNIVPAKDGQTIQAEEFENLAENRLAEVVGKEVAEKIVKGEGVADSGTSNAQILRGVDLQIGGEGMKGFYDKMLKKYAEKWGKKFGSKVGVTKIARDYPEMADDLKLLDDLGVEATGSPDHEVWSMPVTKKMRDSVLKKGVPLFSAAGATAATGAAMQDEKQPASERVF